MKVIFHVVLDSNEDGYHGEPKDYYYDHEFILDMEGELPRKGETITFNEIVEDWPDNEDKTFVFYGRSYFVDEVSWYYDKRLKQLLPKFYLWKSEK